MEVPAGWEGTLRNPACLPVLSGLHLGPDPTTPHLSCPTPRRRITVYATLTNRTAFMLSGSGLEARPVRVVLWQAGCPPAACGSSPLQASPCEVRRPGAAPAFVVATPRASGPQAVPAGLCCSGTPEHHGGPPGLAVRWRLHHQALTSGPRQHGRHPLTWCCCCTRRGRWSGPSAQG